jgi:hypothetical protein
MQLWNYQYPKTHYDGRDDHPSCQNRDRNDRHSSTDVVGVRGRRKEMYGQQNEHRDGKNPYQKY